MKQYSLNNNNYLSESFTLALLNCTLVILGIKNIIFKHKKKKNNIHLICFIYIESFFLIIKINNHKLKLK